MAWLVLYDVHIVFLSFSIFKLNLFFFIYARAEQTTREQSSIVSKTRSNCLYIFFFLLLFKWQMEEKKKLGALRVILRNNLLVFSFFRFNSWCKQWLASNFTLKMSVIDHVTSSTHIEHSWNWIASLWSMSMFLFLLVQTANGDINIFHNKQRLKEKIHNQFRFALHFQYDFSLLCLKLIYF